MSGFKILGADCPICKGARKKRDCRESLSTGLIHCRHSEVSPGGQWRYIKDDTLGFGIWAWGESEDRRGDRPLKVSFIPPKKVVPTLPPAARDQGYRALIAQAGLQPQHRAALLQRPHVTESELAAIAPYLFTWQGGAAAQAAAAAAAGLPGVANGQLHPKLYSYAIAVPDHMGQIAGVQVKNPWGSGYYWASSAKHGGPAPNLPNGEIPLGVYGTPNGDGVANAGEGFIKPAIAAARHGGAWIGAAGGHWASSPEQLKATLEAFEARSVVLNADGGAISNTDVMGAYARLATLLDSWGIPLAVRWWGQATEADGDVDEITTRQYMAAQLLPWAEFAAMGAVEDGEKAKDHSNVCTVADSLGLTGHGGNDRKAMALLQEHYRKGKHQPDRIIVNGPEGISPEDEQFLLDGQAPKLLTGRTGCGKTEVIAQLLRNNRDSLPQQLGLAISIALTGGLAGRTHLTPVSSRHTHPTAEALDNAVISIESVYQTAGHQYSAMATDECDVALYRLFASELGQKSQDLNLRRLQSLARQTEHQFNMQANPSPISLDAIEHLTGKRPQIVEIVRDTGLVSKVNVTICEDGFDKDQQRPLRGSKTLVDRLLADAKAGKRVVLFAGGVGNLKAVQRILRQHKIAVTLRDGSYTLAPIAVGFGEAPTDHAALRNVTFICRNAEIGVDLQNDFDSVFLWASPQQTAEDCYQHLSRARALFDGRCQELVIKFPSDNAKFIKVEHLDPAFHLEHIKAKHSYYLGLLRDAQGSHGNDLREIEDRLAELDSIHGFLARYRAESAAGQLFQREYLEQRLVELGWSIESKEPDAACQGRDFNKVLQGLRRKVDEAKAFVIAKGKPTASSYSESRAKQIKDVNQGGFVLDGYRQKIKLVAQIPGAPLHDPEWILEHILDNDRQLPQARLLGLHMLGQDEALASELKHYAKSQQGFNIRFGLEHGPTALMRSMESSHSLSLLSVWVSVLADGPRLILDLLQGDRATIHRLEPDVAEFAARVRLHGDRLNGMARYCLGKSDGFVWDEPDDMAIVNKFLSAFLGLDMVRVGQVRVGKERPTTHALAGSKVGVFREANKATMALARTEGQIGNVEAQQAAQANILDAAIATGNQGAADNARAEMATIAERLKALKEKLVKQQRQQADSTQAAAIAWIKISRQFKGHLDMGACAAMGWVGYVNLGREQGVNLNLQTRNLISQFRLTPPEAPPPPPDNPPESPPSEGRTVLVNRKSPSLTCGLQAQDGNFYHVRWPDGRDGFVPVEDYAPLAGVSA